MSERDAGSSPRWPTPTRDFGWALEHDDEVARRALGKAIAIRRVELGLKRNDLRDRSGLSYPYIAELENGTKRPSTKALTALAHALELSPSELLERAERLREEADAAPERAPLPMAAAAPPSAPPPEPPRSRWFHAGTAARPSAGVERVRSAIEDLSPEEKREALQLLLAEEWVREIVRDELRRAGLVPIDQR